MGELMSLIGADHQKRPSETNYLFQLNGKDFHLRHGLPISPPIVTIALKVVYASTLRGGSMHLKAKLIICF